MTTRVLIAGARFRNPEQRTSKAGKPFFTATLRAKDGEATAWWKIILFSETAGAELIRMRDGDSLSAQGALRVETYEKDGQTRINLTVIADSVLAPRQPPKERRPRAAPATAPSPDHSRLARHTGDGVDVFGDAVPF